MLFKVNHNLFHIPEAAHIIKASDRRTRGTQRLFVPFTRVAIYKQSFFPRTIQDWNQLPSSTIDISDIEAFKTALSSSLTVQPLPSA